MNLALRGKSLTFRSERVVFDWYSLIDMSHSQCLNGGKLLPVTVVSGVQSKRGRNTLNQNYYRLHFAS